MRFSTLLLPIAALGLLAACGDDSTASNASSASDATTATSNAPVDTGSATTGPATTQPGALPKPEVKLPATLPTDLVVTDLTEGTGAAAATGDTVVVHYVGVRSEDGAEFARYDCWRPSL
jgi:FKBP-type peptidyl-prolyl cis-trans isomerase